MSEKRNKNLVALFFVFLCTLTVNAQTKVTVSGIITDAQTHQPVIYANVAFPELGIGTSSNEKGEFLIKNVPVGTHSFSISYVGYKEYSVNLRLEKDIVLEIKLQQQSLGLKEVIVTAENSKEGTTSAKINSNAIEHVQASSLKEIMQLIPGNLAENPNLADPAKISIREVDTDINSALGTSIVVDGIPLSNDGNMQQSIEPLNNFSSAAGSGFDLRQITVDNIESITIDVGIPSAEHGNLTSGAVHIKTKTGGSPYSVKMQANPHTKQFSLGKGYLLHKNSGVININAGYTNSYEYLWKQTNQFERINATTKYTNTFFRNSNPLNIQFKADYLQSLDGLKWDPDMKAEEEHYAQDQRMQTKLSALWSLNKSFFKSISLDAGFSKTWQDGFEKTLEANSSGANIIISSTENGEYEALYGPASYYSEVNYDGRPFDIFAKIKAKFYHKSNLFTNNILLGAEWRTTGNNGEGRTFDVTQAPAGTSLRPRPFSDIPSLNQLSFFAEDKIEVKLGSTQLNIMAGIRMDNIQPNGIFSSDGNLSFDPRLNIRYELLNRNQNYLLRNMSLRLGYGKTTKAPTLSHLYPDKEYNDIINFNYYPELVVATTEILEDTRNYNLEAAKSEKFEAGIDFQLGKIKSRITGFYEKHEGGFILDQDYILMEYKRYEQADAGLYPYFIEGDGVFYDDPETGEQIAVPYELDYKYKDYGIFQNASTRIKRGVEYSINFGKIEALRTSFILNGAWLQTESYTTDAPFWDDIEYTVYEGNTSTQEKFLVKFPNENGYGVVKERLNSNLNIITHIPEIKMLVTLTTQMLWYEKDWRKIYDEYKLYTLNELRDYLNQPNLFSTHDEEDFYYYLPVSYRNYDNIEYTYNISDFENSLHQTAIDFIKKYRFEKQTLSPLVLCNIRISKDIGQRFKLSFFANNFLNIRPWELKERDGQYIRRNSEPYFGADIKMQF